MLSVSSQLANTVTRARVHHMGLIGLDSAGIHADNTPMKTLARRLKCRLRRDPEDGALMLAERAL